MKKKLLFIMVLLVSFIVNAQYVIKDHDDNVFTEGMTVEFNSIVYEEAELKKIVEALYNKDFGSFPKMNMNARLQLNNGKKWKLFKK